MNIAPQFSLRWNNYITHVTDSFNELRSENDLVDVTLCCEGGKIKAHKILLSACSNYFRQIFKENPCQHPVIIFRNVKFEDLTSIVNFMYNGEVNIFQEQLESFLITAELLEVKGLTDSVENDNPTVYSSLPENLSLRSQTQLSNDSTDLLSEQPINLATIQPYKDDIPITNSTQTFPKSSSQEISDLSPETISTDDNLNSNQNTILPSEDINMQVDNQTSTVEELSDKNSNESELAKFRCQLCPKGFKHPTSLTLHKDSHEGKTQCPVCHRSFSRSYDMRSHLQRIHQGKQLTIKEIRFKSNESVSNKQF